MRTLYAKLSVALIAIIGLLGTAFFVVEQVSTRLYYEELTQRLNAPIAMYVTGEQPLIADGIVNTEAVQSLAHQAMIINPTVEVYLLDPAGRILAHVLPPESLQTERVDLRPIRRLLADGAEMPLRSTDPRNTARAKIFSAAEVRNNDKLEGYLYVVLGGKRYDELASDIRGSYVQQLTLWATVAIVLAGATVGVLVFGLLTKRLTRLTGDVQRFTESDFDSAVAVHRNREDGDEIDRLGSAFATMSAKIQDQFESLKEADRLRRELISNVSHDLRTPLASMQGYVETLLIKHESLSDDERRRYLQITRKHAQRLGRLIGDLFELSKLDAATMRPSPEAFSLAELLQDLAQDFELEAAKRQIQITIDGPQEGTTVFADIGLIQRVLENLLRNALKFTPRGGRITISVRGKPDSVAVAVADTGCGIPQHELSRIFDRFYGTEKDEAPRSVSTGLGLAIVKRILDLHGSRITVASEINEGTRFEFDLRAGRAA